MGLLDGFGDLFGSKSESQQQRKFSSEAETALQREIPAFLQIAPLLNTLLQGALQPGTGAIGQGVRASGATALPAIEATGLAAGLDLPTLAEILQDLDPADPAFRDILQQLSQAVSTSVPSITDPRFAVGLRPTTETESRSTPSPFSILTGVGGTGLAAAGLFA